MQTTTMLLVHSGYMLEARNQSVYFGEYFPEDDWLYHTIADTPEDACKKFWLEFPFVSIIPDKFWMFSVTYIVARGEKLVVEKEEVDYDLNSEEFIALRERAFNERRSRLASDAQRAQKEIKDRENKETFEYYKQLKERYERTV